MKIFVGWPYDAMWVETYVLPLVETYGVEVLTGRFNSPVEVNLETMDSVQQKRV